MDADLTLCLTTVQGSLKLDVLDCGWDVKDISIKLDGGASWLYQGYECTVWDDLAHGKGVFVAQQGLVRYEGEWLRNTVEGHGVTEVEITKIHENRVLLRKKLMKCVRSGRNAYKIIFMTRSVYGTCEQKIIGAVCIYIVGSIGDVIYAVGTSSSGDVIYAVGTSSSGDVIYAVGK